MYDEDIRQEPDALNLSGVTAEQPVSEEPQVLADVSGAEEPVLSESAPESYETPEPERTPEEAKPEASKLSDREVMQHTASIWRYRTVIEDGTELHTEFHSKYQRVGRCEAIGARVRGKKHKHEGTNCDDWFETAESAGCLIAVVADGAGSKPLSRIGARVSCEGASREAPAGFQTTRRPRP